MKSVNYISFHYQVALHYVHERMSIPIEKFYKGLFEADFEDIPRNKI